MIPFFFLRNFFYETENAAASAPCTRLSVAPCAASTFASTEPASSVYQKVSKSPAAGLKKILK